MPAAEISMSTVVRTTYRGSMTMPGWQPVPPAPKPGNSRTLRTVLIVVGVVLLLCCGGAIVGGVFLFRGVSHAVGPARDAADEFMTDPQTGDLPGAYDRLCADTRSRFTRDVFVDGAAVQPKIKSHRIVGVNVSNYNGKSSATVTAELTLDTGFVDRHAFTLVNEDGTWKVCGRPY
jgi:hypothetical protein